MLTLLIYQYINIIYYIYIFEYILFILFYFILFFIFYFFFLKIIKYETCWVITNIAAGTTEQTRTIIDAGAVPVLIELLRSENKEVRTQAAWSLGNIAGDCGEFRDIVLHGGTLQPLLELWKGNDSIESKNHMLQVAMWTLANLCRWHRSDWDVVKYSYKKKKKINK